MAPPLMALQIRPPDPGAFGRGLKMRREMEDNELAQLAQRRKMEMSAQQNQRLQEKATQEAEMHVAKLTKLDAENEIREAGMWASHLDGATMQDLPDRIQQARDMGWPIGPLENIQNQEDLDSARVRFTALGKIGAGGQPAPPEIVKLQKALDKLPPKSPNRKALQDRINRLGAESRRTEFERLSGVYLDLTAREARGETLTPEEKWTQQAYQQELTKDRLVKGPGGGLISVGGKPLPEFGSGLQPSGAKPTPVLGAKPEVPPEREIQEIKPAKLTPAKITEFTNLRRSGRDTLKEIDKAIELAHMPWTTGLSGKARRGLEWWDSFTSDDPEAQQPATDLENSIAFIIAKSWKSLIDGREVSKTDKRWLDKILPGMEWTATKASTVKALKRLKNIMEKADTWYGKALGEKKTPTGSSGRFHHPKTGEIIIKSPTGEGWVNEKTGERVY